MKDQPLPVILSCKSNGSGPNLVILHGLFGTRQNWNTVALKLAGRYTVHSMDLRNHGTSAHRAQMDYPSMAADVVASCQHLGIEKTHLLGHSMGGKVAMQISQQTPPLLDKLVVVDIAPKAYPPNHSDVLAGLSSLDTEHLPSRRSADALLSGFVDDAGVRAFLLKNLYRTEDGSYRLRLNLAAIKNSYPAIAADIQGESAFDGPTLFIKGANSDYLQRDDTAVVLQRFPNARLKVVGGAGHWPHAEKPDVVIKLIGDFLAAN